MLAAKLVVLGSTAGAAAAFNDCAEKVTQLATIHTFASRFFMFSSIELVGCQ